MLGMPDTVALNINNVNIDSIEAVNMQIEKCNTNRSDAKKTKHQAGSSWGKGEMHKH